jgi:hypothetical protein
MITAYSICHKDVSPKNKNENTKIIDAQSVGSQPA